MFRSMIGLRPTGSESGTNVSDATVVPTEPTAASDALLRANFGNGKLVKLWSLKMIPIGIVIRINHSISG